MGLNFFRKHLNLIRKHSNIFIKFDLFPNLLEQLLNRCLFRYCRLHYLSTDINPIYDSHPTTGARVSALEAVLAVRERLHLRQVRVLLERQRFVNHDRQLQQLFPRV